jgi:hypothetical protein
MTFGGDLVRPTKHLRRVEQTDALLEKTVVRLPRECSPDLLCEAAQKELLELRPHLLEALGILTDLDGRRGLTEEEQARQRAFRRLLEVAG